MDFEPVAATVLSEKEAKFAVQLLKEFTRPPIKRLKGLVKMQVNYISLTAMLAIAFFALRVLITVM
jgi:hypothetical protein